MKLSSELLRQFAKVVTDSDTSEKDPFLYGTAVKSGDEMFVQLDGSTVMTPVLLSADAKDDDRVMVTIKNHVATVIGNLSSPALNSSSPYLTENFASVQNLNALNATVHNLSGDYANFVTATVDNLNAINGQITNFDATYARIDDLNTLYLQTSLANIDIANIDTAKVNELYATTGLIKRVTISEGHVTDFLDAVQVDAASITAGTLIADRILLRGNEQSLVYALNNFGELTSTQVNTIDGYVLTDRTINADKLVAHSITANEIDVENLFAQNITATGTIKGVTLDGAMGNFSGKITASTGKIGVFNIANCLYTSTASLLQSTNGNIYIGSDGIAFGKSYLNNNGAIILNAVDIDGTFGTIEGGHALFFANNSEWPSIELISATGTVSCINVEATSQVKVTKTSGGYLFQAISDAKNSVQYRAQNSLRAGQFGISASGEIGIWDATNGSWVIKSGTDTSIAIPHSTSITGTLTASGNANLATVTTYNGNFKPIGSYGTDGRRIAYIASRGSGSTKTVRFQGQWSDDGSTTTYSSLGVTVSSSDARLKENIEDAKASALDVIMQIKARQFDWKGSGEHQNIGVIADELEKIDKRFAVGGGYDEDGTMDIKTVDTFYLVCHLLKGIQELYAKILNLENRLENKS